MASDRARYREIWLLLVAIFIAVAAIDIRLEGQSARVASLVGLLAAVAGMRLERLVCDARGSVRGAVSPVALAGLALGLSVAQDVTGYGLTPLHALLAVCAAAAVAVLVSRIHKLTSSADRVLIAGGGAVADALSAAFRQAGTVVVGRLDDAQGEEVLGSFDQLERIAREQRVDTVAFAYSRTGDERLADVATRCRELDLAVAVVPRLFAQFGQRTRLRRINGMPLLVVDPLPHEARSPILSRIFDIVVASVLLVLTLPIWMLIALAIEIDEPGPVLYRARRVGRHGREFDMLKFRKMRRDATGARLTLSDDERFTRIGRLLTRTKLDELPQLINVLRGEMALVGPRPEDPLYVAEYPQEFAEILRCRPGITGLSQIQYRDEAPLLVGEDFEERYRNDLLPKKIDLDRYYAISRCLALDVRILGWTLVALFSGARVHRHELTRSLRFERTHEPTEAEQAATKVLEVA
jgi:lipopolysaccharide/colanic/teichoic acid biosynthesis glycosyltransferase